MKNFTRHLHQLCLKNPDQPILHLLFNDQPDKDYTYSDLLAGAAGYAQALRSEGTPPGDVVIIILQHSEELIFAFWGTVLHGGIPSIMPFLTEKLSPEQYRQSLSALFAVTRPSAVITYAGFVTEVQQALQMTSFAPCKIIVAEMISPVAGTMPQDFDGYLRHPEDIVLLQHSSGTTGLQKGVALSHGAVFNQLTSYSQAIQLRSSDVVVSWLPLYHDMGLIAGFLLPILNGIPLVLMSPFDWVRAPYRLFQAGAKYGGTLAWLPNFAYNFCAQKIRARQLENLDLSSWRALINCSEPMYLSSHEIFIERFSPYGLKPEALATCYAMAENVFAVTQGGIAAEVVVDQIDARIFATEKRAVPAADTTQALRLLSAGQPISNTKIRILSEQRQDVKDRQVGEIAIYSNCLLTRYFRRPEITQEAFFEGWYLTGDLGYQVNGELFVTGRKKDLIIVGGKNIYPQDLENLASAVKGIHPGRVAAFGVPNPVTGTEDVVIVAETDQTVLENELACQALSDEVRAKVTQGSDIAVRYVYIVEQGWLIKTSSGKVARSANREKYNHLHQGEAAGRQAGSNS